MCESTDVEMITSYILKIKEPNDKIQLPYNNKYPAIVLNYPERRRKYLDTLFRTRIPFEIIMANDVDIKGILIL